MDDDAFFLDQNRQVHKDGTPCPENEVPGRACPLIGTGIHELAPPKKES